MELTSTIAGQRDGSQGDHQTRDISWWPKPSAWLGSGLNVGYWSKDCESWFRKRLGDIKAGKAILRTQSQWRHSLKFTSDCVNVAQKNEQLAAEFLARRS